jgi:drug/metabolite transporter (DMT)-like permease
MSRRNIVLGITAMCLAMLGFVTNDTQVKLASEALPIGEVIFLRGVFSTVIVFAVLLATRQFAYWRTLRDPALFWRNVGDVGATVVYLTALAHIPLSSGVIVLQTIPLVVTAAAALFLREHVGWRRWAAVVIGLSGVMIVIRPGLTGFNPYSLLALLAVLFIALRDISTNRLSQAVPHLLVVGVAVFLEMLAGGAMGIAEDWVWPSLPYLAETVGAGICLVVGHWFIIVALRSAPVSVTAPFNYTNVVWAILLELLIWGSRPDLLTLIGAALIIGSGGYTLYRERKVAGGTVTREPSIGGAGP